VDFGESLLFVGLSVPVLVFILVYNYNRNSAGIVSILNDAVAQTSRAGIDRTQELIEATELFAGTRRRVATRKMPTFVLRTRVSSSEKAPRGKFEHRWFGEQPSQQERRQAGHSTSPMSQAEVKLYPVPVQLPQRAISI
jgi:hypothetical protein